MKNIFAWTAPEPTLPPYISVNEHADGTVWLTVRGRRGNSAHIELTVKQLLELAAAIERHQT